MKLLTGSKILLLDYFFVFCLVIYGGNATMFTRGYGNILHIGAYLPILYAIIIGIRHKMTISTNFVVSIVVFVIYYVLASITNNYFSMGFISYWIITLFISYVVCKCYGVRYLELFETIIFHLSVIAIIMWLLYMAMPDGLMNICRKIQFSKSFESSVDVVNIIVYTLLDFDQSGDEYYMFYRNSGFAFEPGAYACFLCFAIACNIIRNKGLKIKGNYPLLVFLLALFSTESTTGGISLIIILVLWVIANLRTSRTYLYLLLLVPIVIWILNQGFVGDKLINEFDASQELSYTSANDSGASRMMSFRLYLEEFKARPLFGLAGDPNTILESRGYQYSLHSGIGKLLAGYGIIMTILFSLLCALSNKLLNSIQGKNGIVLLGALIGSMVSYSMWEYPVFFAFIMLGFFCFPKNQSYQDNNS